jgi:hypothetical protein
MQVGGRRGGKETNEACSRSMLSSMTRQNNMQLSEKHNEKTFLQARQANTLSQLYIPAAWMRRNRNISKNLAALPYHLPPPFASLTFCPPLPPPFSRLRLFPRLAERLEGEGVGLSRKG